MKKEQKIIADRIREVLINSLRLPMKPEDIEDTMPLFGEGLGLDSVDALELVAAVDSEYGVSLTSEDHDDFLNVTTLSVLIFRRMGDRYASAKN